MLNHITGHMELSRCAPRLGVTSAEGLMSEHRVAAAILKGDLNIPQVDGAASFHHRMD